ncbi:MAG: tRNA (N6-isopentenyl adenosine(37)-C2)-methylthiotransferase MiaB [Syntrophobacteraceae bacterium CG2_30_61_12]|nr:MAG: tRNA (N6-isopentenyl adenosine(37)-C2)-methylthiotransferase MiaB [Syntrophobacteraceae bacterium CG2_30_61_12]
MEHAIAAYRQPVKRLFIQTFGCQMNEYDSLRVRRMLGTMGYETTPRLDRATVIFLNTCSVRDKAEQKVYSFLGRLRALKAQRPQLKIIVAGCMAQQLGTALLSRFPHLDLVLGTRAIGALPELLEGVQADHRRLAHLPDTDQEGWQQLFQGADQWISGVSAPLTIMQGCNNFCTYCIVPHVRGRERSRPSAEIVREIQLLTAAGAKEVVLLGQNVNSYGQGLDESIDFPGLLRLIERTTDIRRVRFTTSHPKDLTADLMRCLAELKTLCRHIHLPFQAGSDRILKKMNRHYTVADYLDKVDRLRRACPEIALTADVMVGFPGEREDDFEGTLQLIDTVRFDNLFSFRYSDRPFARAVQFPDKVDEALKAERLVRLQALQASITLAKNQEEIGRLREILVEGESRAAEGQLSGRTSHNRIVNLVGPRQIIGRLETVKIVAAYMHSLKGERIRNSEALS